MSNSMHTSRLDLASSASVATGFDAMNEPMIPAQRDAKDYDNKGNDSTCSCKDDSIAHSNEPFNLNVSGADDFMEKVFDEDYVAKDANETSHHANDIECNLTMKEAQSRLSKSSFHKIKSRLNSNNLTEEEREMTEEDNAGGSCCAQSARNTTKIFFCLATSAEPNILKHAKIVADRTSSETHYFHECFKGKASPEKRKIR